MAAVTVIVRVFFLCLLIIAAGCESAPSPAEPVIDTDTGPEIFSFAGYAPAKIDIMPLTEFTRPGNTLGRQGINLYVSLLDCFGCQIKSPGVFRFELYEYVQRSSESKGKRTVIWPDADLNEKKRNNDYWRDFLRAYEFNLDFEPESGRTYILEVTFLSTAEKRFSAEYCLKPKD